MFLKSCPTLLKSKLPELSSSHPNSYPTRTTRSTSKPRHQYHLNVACHPNPDPGPPYLYHHLITTLTMTLTNTLTMTLT
jgi:hypothetical protein